ncbi:hypothetical protein ACYRFS_12760 [Listeria kieliensis]
MGTYASILVEKRDSKTQAWTTIEKDRKRDWIYWGQNYSVFAVLANVRNQHSFFSLNRGDIFEPICQPKGMPKDPSEVLRRHWEEYREVGYSSSYLTLKELKAFDWKSKQVMRCGYVGEENYLKFVDDKKKGKCSEASYIVGGIGGANIIVLSNQEMENLIKGERPREKEESYYTIVTWKASYEQECADFLRSVIPTLEKIENGVGSDNVRIAFFFFD